MQIRKMLAAFISVVMMCSVVSVPAFAVDETQIVTDLVSPAYEYAMKTENYLTITSCALLATTSLVASADDSASLYQTTNGGPTHLSETLEIYKNTGNSYYAECTYITSGTLRVTGNNNTPDKTLSFTTEKRIDFLATTNESTLRFTAKLTPPSSTTPSQANITIGA